MNDKLIRRMINKGYSDEEIVLRLRCKLELVVAIRELIHTENKRSHVVQEDPQDIDWDLYE
jgi:hypothetical protein